jgi:hypothetical protein
MPAPRAALTILALLGAGAALAAKTIVDEDGKRKSKLREALERRRATRNRAESAVVKTDVVPFVVVPDLPGAGMDFEEKNLVDAWLFANREEINMFGDERGTKYEFATPLKDGDGGRKNDKYAWIASRNPTKPWMARYPKHWGREPDRQTKDYVKLPGGYGFGSSTTKAWIEEKMAADEAAKTAEIEAASPKASPAVKEAKPVEETTPVKAEKEEAEEPDEAEEETVAEESKHL